MGQAGPRARPGIQSATNGCRLPQGLLSADERFRGSCSCAPSGKGFMRIVMFYHTLLSDWNHGNAHFLRGVVTELMTRGHQVEVFEPEDSWSRKNLLTDYGPTP